MIRLITTKDNFNDKNVDYVLDKTDKFYDMLYFLTPKFEGKWEFLLLDPTIKFVKELLRNVEVPDWVNIYIQVNQKKVNEIALDFPDMVPRKQTKKEAFNELIASLTHIVDTRASKMLFEAFKQKPKETTEVIRKLDADTESPNISVKQVQGSITFTKHVYASDVINAFLLDRNNKWKLYKSLVTELGEHYAYYACRRYVKNLLKQKEEFLQNKEVTLYIVNQIDAPSICYAYVLFANSTSYKQLYAVLYNLQQRNEDTLQRVVRANM